MDIWQRFQMPTPAPPPDGAEWIGIGGARLSLVCFVPHNWPRRRIGATRKLVGVAGFEPATPSSRTRRATSHLSFSLLRPHYALRQLLPRHLGAGSDSVNKTLQPRGRERRRCCYRRLRDWAVTQFNPIGGHPRAPSEAGGIPVLCPVWPKSAPKGRGDPTRGHPRKRLGRCHLCGVSHPGFGPWR
jgi:hypothetical protein